MNDGKSIQQIVQEAAETGESYGRYVVRTELARLQAHHAEATGKHRHHTKPAKRDANSEDPSNIDKREAE